MTPEPPQTPKVSKQKNTKGATGFIDGEHHHHYPGAPDPRVAVQASIKASNSGAVLGRPIDQWDPADLGVHNSIIVQDETTPTPYLPRDHDTQLRRRLQELESPNAGSRLVLVVGTSCTGKTRTLFEAVQEVLPDWPLVAPKNDSDLARVLLDGVPAHTVVWLDELQDQLTKTSHGVTAANAIHQLLQSSEVGPIMFAGTIWPTNRDALLARPAPNESSDGAGAISRLLKNAVVVEVPETFTDAALAAARNSDDARLQKAFSTASETSQPERGRKLTQVLAGGTQLANRLHPPPDNAPPNKFSPAARAVLHAAGDLRRVGMTNPLPRWAIEGTAPGYLKPPSTRPARTWLLTALDEATRDATTDDPITGSQSLDVHAKGVPALTPNWTTSPTGQELEAYDLHDYLYQDHLNRHRASPTRPQLWDTLTSHYDDLEEPWHIASAALGRGLLTTASSLFRPAADAGNRFALFRLVELLAMRGDKADSTELRAIADAFDNHAQVRLAELLATRRDQAALTELRILADDGSWTAQNKLGEILATRGDDAALAELRARAAGDDDYALSWLAKLSVSRGDQDALTELRALAQAGDWKAQERLAELLAASGDQDALTELRALADAGNWNAQERLAELLIAGGDQDALTELRALADAGNWKAQERLAELLAASGDQDALTELRALADASIWNWKAQERLAELLATSGDQDALTELRTRAAADDWNAQERLAELLATSGDQDALTELRALAAAGDRSAQGWLGRGLATGGDQADMAELRTRADASDRVAQHHLAALLATRGDQDALTELEARADDGDHSAQSWLGGILASPGQQDTLTEVRARANAGDYSAQDQLAEVLAIRGNRMDLRELRARADAGDYSAQSWLAEALATSGDQAALTELRTRAAADNHPAQARLAELLATSGGPPGQDQLAEVPTTRSGGKLDLTGLRALVLTGEGGLNLLIAYRKQSANRHISELDCDALPVYSDSSGQGQRLGE